jgi:hypothetical protein
MVKPSGTSGFFQVRANEQGDISGAFVPTPYSTEKAEIERQMVVSFISSMNKNLATSCEEFFLSNPKQNQENNIDFTVDSPNGLAYLELMEIAPLKGPYTTAPSSYKPYEFAKAVLAGIKQKSDHYAGTQGRDIFLLLYITHWSFIPSSSTLACLLAVLVGSAIAQVQSDIFVLPTRPERRCPPVDFPVSSGSAVLVRS